MVLKIVGIFGYPFVNSLIVSVVTEPDTMFVSRLTAVYFDLNPVSSERFNDGV